MLKAGTEKKDIKQEESVKPKGKAPAEEKGDKGAKGPGLDMYL